MNLAPSNSPPTSFRRRLANGQRAIPLVGLAAVPLGILLGVTIARLDPPFLAAIALMAAIGFAVVMIRPQWGLLGLVAVVYLNLSDIFVKVHHLPSINKPLVALMLVATLANAIVLHHQPLVSDRMVWLLLGYWAVLVASMFIAVDRDLAQEAVFDDFPKDVLIFFVIVNLARTPARFRQLIWTLILCGSFMATISVVQELTGSYDDKFWGFGQVAVGHIVGQVNKPRIAGPIGDPNYYGQIMVVLVPLTLYRLWNEDNVWLKIVAGYTAAVLILSIVFTFSRGAFLSLLVVLATIAWHKKIRPGYVITALLLLLPLARLAPPEYSVRMRTVTSAIPGLKSPGNKADASVRGRTSENLIAIQMFLDHPLLGVGKLNYEAHYMDYSRRLGIDQRIENREPHDLYLEVAAETGLIGLIAFGAILYAAIQGLTDAARRFAARGQSTEADLTVSLLIGLAGYLATSVFLHAAYPRYLWLLVALSVVPRLASARSPLPGATA